jgi:hypothetical protein
MALSVPAGLLLVEIGGSLVPAVLWLGTGGLLARPAGTADRTAPQVS